MGQPQEPEASLMRERPGTIRGGQASVLAVAGASIGPHDDQSVVHGAEASETSPVFGGNSSLAGSAFGPIVRSEPSFSTSAEKHAPIMSARRAVCLEVSVIAGVHKVGKSITIEVEGRVQVARDLLESFAVRHRPLQRHRLEQPARETLTPPRSPRARHSSWTGPPSKLRSNSTRPSFR